MDRPSYRACASNEHTQRKENRDKERSQGVKLSGMSWRNELKLADLPAGEALELTCPKCGAARYATAAELSAHKMSGALDGETVSLATAYLDQIEARLRCRRCGGPGRLSYVIRGLSKAGKAAGLPPT